MRSDQINKSGKSVKTFFLTLILAGVLPFSAQAHFNSAGRCPLTLPFSQVSQQLKKWGITSYPFKNIAPDRCVELRPVCWQKVITIPLRVYPLCKNPSVNQVTLDQPLITSEQDHEPGIEPISETETVTSSEEVEHEESLAESQNTESEPVESGDHEEIQHEPEAEAASETGEGDEPTTEPVNEPETVTSSPESEHDESMPEHPDAETEPVESRNQEEIQHEPEAASETPQEHETGFYPQSNGFSAGNMRVSPPYPLQQGRFFAPAPFIPQPSFQQGQVMNYLSQSPPMLPPGFMPRQTPMPTPQPGMYYQPRPALPFYNAPALSFRGQQPVPPAIYPYAQFQALPRPVAPFPSAQFRGYYPTQSPYLPSYIPSYVPRVNGIGNAPLYGSPVPVAPYPRLTLPRKKSRGKMRPAVRRRITPYPVPAIRRSARKVPLSRLKAPAVVHPVFSPKQVLRGITPPQNKSAPVPVILPVAVTPPPLPPIKKPSSTIRNLAEAVKDFLSRQKTDVSQPVILMAKPDLPPVYKPWKHRLIPTSGSFFLPETYQKNTQPLAREIRTYLKKKPPVKEKEEIIKEDPTIIDPKER